MILRMCLLRIWDAINHGTSPGWGYLRVRKDFTDRLRALAAKRRSFRRPAATVPCPGLSCQPRGCGVQSLPMDVQHERTRTQGGTGTQRVA